MSLDADLEFLRDEFGFRVAYESAPRPGERFTTVLESSELRVEIENELGVRVLYFTSLRDPNERHVDNALLSFIEYRHRLPRGREAAVRLRTHMPEIVAAFAPARPAEWWRAYSAYRDERLAQMKRER